jgi:L-fuculose-phosphate aldolase
MTRGHSRERELRDAVVATAQAMNVAGINRGKSGNVSARIRSVGFDGFLVTPTGMPYDTMTADDIVAMTLNGEARGARHASSEWRFHSELYRTRDDLHGIVHAHPPFATTLACLHRGIPPFHYMIAAAGGRDIRCAPYATFGSPELAALAVAAMADRRACLLANHGMIAAGEDLAAALSLAIEVEGLAEMYWRALQIGEPAILSDAEMATVIEKFHTYGQP